MMDKVFDNTFSSTAEPTAKICRAVYLRMLLPS